MGQLSSPGDLSFFRAKSLLKTTVGVISMESVESTAGIEVVSSQVNAVEKYIFIKKGSHFGIRAYTVEESNSVTVGRTFVLELISRFHTLD